MAEYRGQSHKFQLSNYQRPVIDWIIDARSGALVVQALAGTGKSSTLESCVKYLRFSKPNHKAQMCAFNVPIAKEMGIRLQPYSCVRVATIHSVGFSGLKWKFPALKKDDAVDGSKYAILVRMEIDRLCNNIPSSHPAKEDIVDQLRDLFRPALKVIDLCRLGLQHNVWKSDNARVRIRNMSDICVDHGIMYEEEMEQILSNIITKCVKQGKDLLNSTVDFVDMVWGPCVLNLRLWQNPVVMVDEAQDLSPAQLEVVMKSVWDRKYGGKLIFVGDENQAIYRFAGADSDSMNKIIARTNPTILPLNTCYRCSKAVIREAQQIVPEIEARADAPEGSVQDIDFAKMLPMLDEESMVICRKNAPLVSLCFKLLSEGRKAKIIGRNIGQELVNMVKKFAEKKGFVFSNLVDEVNNWRRKQCEFVLKRNGNNEEDTRLVNIHDKANCVVYLYRKLDPLCLEEFCHQLQLLFAEDDSDDFITLTSAHRSKGLEAKTVFIIEPSAMPLPVRNEKDMIQEMNLKYVAITRAMIDLFWVHGEQEEE